jgi:putative transposase
MAMLVMLREAWSARRSAQIQFLKFQVELLRQKVPGNRVILSPEDRQRLLGLGSQLGHHVDDLIGIVTVKTCKQWIRQAKAGRASRPVGRRRVIPPYSPRTDRASGE